VDAILCTRKHLDVGQARARLGAGPAASASLGARATAAPPSLLLPPRYSHTAGTRTPLRPSSTSVALAEHTPWACQHRHDDTYTYTYTAQHAPAAQQEVRHGCVQRMAKLFTQDAFYD
jgi:hypothetical protein